MVAAMVRQRQELEAKVAALTPSPSEAVSEEELAVLFRGGIRGRTCQVAGSTGVHARSQATIGRGTVLTRGHGGRLCGAQGFDGRATDHRGYDLRPFDTGL